MSALRALRQAQVEELTGENEIIEVRELDYMYFNF